MPKTLVAMVVTKQENGYRTYSLFTRDEILVRKITVMDAGQGASQAREIANRTYSVSGADWALKLAQKHGVK